MASKLESIEIFPGENGGHRVVPNFKREAGQKSGAMDGGMYIERPKAEERFFGKGQEGQVLSHVGKAINLPLNAGNNKPDAGY
jgi:hypothetical protein